MRKTTGTVIRIILALTVLGSLFLISTNSRNSILIKEEIYVAGSALALLIAAAAVLLNGGIASERFSRSLAVSFVLLILWLFFRHYTGIQSVNALKYISGIVALGGLVLVMALTFTEKIRDRLLWVIVLSTVLLFVYAILQSFGLIIFHWDAGLAQTARSSGTMGNANLLGSISMAMLPVGAGFILSRRRLSGFRYISAAAFVLLAFAALLASKTRGSLIGLLAIAIFMLFVPFIRKNRKRFVTLLLVLLVIIGGSIIFLGNRMEELTHSGSGTMRVRKLIWSGTVSMILSNPFLGYGPGSFQIVFPEFRNPEYFTLGVSHNTLHAHCEYLEILVDTGIAGLLLWTFVAFSLFGIMRRKGKFFFWNEESLTVSGNNLLVLGLVAGVIALLAEASVSVALRWPPSALLLALFTGLLLASVPSGFNPLKGPAKYGLAATLFLITVFLGLVALPAYARAMKSGKELFIGKDMYLTHIQLEMEGAINAAKEWSINGSDVAIQTALFRCDNARQVADSSIVWCGKCIETNNDDLGGWYALGSAYVSAARMYHHLSPPLASILRMNGMVAEDSEKSQNYLRLGLAAYDSLITRAPNYAEVHNNLSLVWINLGYPDSALASLRRAWALHAHNRKGYAEKITFLIPLSMSLDGVFLKWQESLQTIERLKQGNIQTSARDQMFRELLFDYGTTFLRFKDSADSLSRELSDILSSGYPLFASDIIKYTDLQVQRMQEGLDYVQQLENGDTAGVRRSLDSIPRDEIEMLPIHRTIEGLILTSQGSIEGMQTLSKIIEYFSWNSIENLAAWPFDLIRMERELNEALLKTGLVDYRERELYLLNEINILNFDRRIFQILNFVKSLPYIENSTKIAKNDFEALWARLGGPFYCIMNLRDEETGVAFMCDSSLLDYSYKGIIALEAADSLNAEMIKLEIQWLYILFSSSFAGTPNYSSVQIVRIVSLLADARVRLVELVGEDETQYQISSMLKNLSDKGIPQVDGIFSNYLETLRNDLIMGRITEPDLP